MIASIRWTVLSIWLAWLVLYWGAGLGLLSNFVRAFRSTRFFYDRFFILGLVLLSNVMLWSGYVLLRGRWADPLPEGWQVLVYVGGALVLIGAPGTFWCRRQMRHSWSAGTTLVENHELIQHGPYAVVRHPIYAFACLMALGTALVFPFWWNLLAGAGMAALYVLKLRVEERFLTHELPGYVAYCRRVRFRLLPGVW